MESNEYEEIDDYCMDKEDEELCSSSYSSGSSISFNKKFALLFGIEPAIYIAALIWKKDWFINHGKIKKSDKSFFNTQEDMNEATLLPPHKQTNAINILKRYHFIDVKKKGCPAKNYFSIHYKILKLASSIPIEHINDQSLTALFTDDKSPYPLVIKHINDYINLLNLNALKGNLLNKTSSKEEVSETDVSHPASSKLHKRSKGQMLMSAKLSVKPLKEKKPVKPYEASSKAEHLMKYWKGKDLHVPRPDSDSYRNSLISFDKLLSGKAFNGTEFENYENTKIDIKDIRKAIDRFALMSLNPDYEPRDINYKKQLSKFTPANFIFNSYQKTTNGYGRSRFIYCLENEPKLIREKDVFVEDKYPITSKKVANQFKERILGGADIKFTNGDINDFRKAANFATDLFKSNKGKLMGSYANMEPFRIVNCLFEALESSGADLKKVKPHWLCNSVMQKQLPQYLYQSAIFQDIDCSAKEKTPHYYNFGEPFRG